ncbi:MAG: transglycosylase domain-containing protein, partial [Oscillospiraceae bacterium]|nr:transglycosylase domain-containing protein [Oscillospiraceae bacterium]
ANITSGRYSQGGSTLTQQLAKNMYFSFDKQLERKVAEVLVAFELEKMYSKEEILAMYCTLAYFGQNCYGVKQASAYYYGILPSQLDETQSFQLVETLKAPSINNPSTMN